MLNPLLNFFYLKIRTQFLKNPLYHEKKEFVSGPVFILSAGRSGSTLLRKIVLTSGKANIPPESGSLIPVLAVNYLKYNHLSWEKLVNKLIFAAEKEETWKLWNINFKEEDINFLKYSLRDKSLHGIIEFIYQMYGKTHFPQANFWGDKTPQLIFYIDIVLKIFPDAKFIFLVRDGRDVISSFTKNQIFQDIRLLSQRWLYSLKVLKKLQKRVPEENLFQIQYEEMVSRPDPTIKKLCDFLNIEYSKGFIENKKVYLGDSFLLHHKNTLKEISPENIGKWKSDLNPGQKKEVEKIIGRKLKELGY